VEHQRERPRRTGRLDRVLLLAAGAEGQRRAQRGGDREQSLHRVLPPGGLCAHGTSSRSASVSRPNSRIANADRMMTAAKARAVSSWGMAVWMRWPRPDDEPAYSAKTAPITATTMPTFAPLNSPGSAAGSST